MTVFYCHFNLCVFHSDGFSKKVGTKWSKWTNKTTIYHS